MKVAIYARVSTDDKDQNPERQKISCEKYAELHNHEVIGYSEDYMTGESNPFEREGFNQLLKLNPEGILIFEISRFSREHPSKVMRRLSDLKNKGIKTISITEQAFNMEGEFSDLIQFIMTWFNNYYLTNLKRNVKSGLERARSQGKTLGRPKVGFNKYRAWKLLFEDQLSLSQVSKELNVSKATINRFKKVCGKDGSLFIKEAIVPKTDVKETGSEEKG